MKFETIHAPDFCVEEFVPKEIFERFGVNSTRFIDIRLPIIAQELRNYYRKSVIINNWRWGGEYKYSGFRTKASTDYTPLSPHTRGNAIDVKIKGVSSTEVQKFIIGSYETTWERLGVGLIETGTNGWTHISVEWFVSPYLMLYDVNNKTLMEAV